MALPPASSGGPPVRGPGSRQGALDPRLAGLLYGLGAALLAAAPLLGVPFAAAFGFFASIPIFYVGFAHGPVSAIIAAAAAVVATSVVGGPIAGLALAAGTAVPAAYAAYLINLARPADELGGPSGRLAWYPLADVLLRLCVTVALGSIALGVAVGYGLEKAQAVITSVLEEAAQTPGALPGGLPPGTDMGDIAAQIAGLLPLAQPFGAVLILLACMNIAMRVARARGVLRRPADDMALALRLPMLGLFAFGAALLLSFADGSVGLAARAFTGALAAGFAVAGFALAHLKLRGSPARAPLLVGLYLVTFLTAGLTIPLMIGFGMFSTARAVPISSPND